MLCKTQTEKQTQSTLYWISDWLKLKEFVLDKFILAQTEKVENAVFHYFSPPATMFSKAFSNIVVILPLFLLYNNSPTVGRKEFVIIWDFVWSISYWTSIVNNKLLYILALISNLSWTMHSEKGLGLGGGVWCPCVLHKVLPHVSCWSPQFASCWFLHVHNSVGETARYGQFYFFPQCLQKTCTADT